MSHPFLHSCSTRAQLNKVLFWYMEGARVALWSGIPQPISPPLLYCRPLLAPILLPGHHPMRARTRHCAVGGAPPHEAQTCSGGKLTEDCPFLAARLPTRDTLGDSWL